MVYHHTNNNNKAHFHWPQCLSRSLTCQSNCNEPNLACVRPSALILLVHSIDSIVDNSILQPLLLLPKLSLLGMFCMSHLISNTSHSDDVDDSIVHFAHHYQAGPMCSIQKEHCTRANGNKQEPPSIPNHQTCPVSQY